MNVASLATSAVAAHQAQTTQAMANAMIKQQTNMEQAIGRMLEQAVVQTASTSAGVDIIV
jgi:hypothetical protein